MLMKNFTHLFRTLLFLVIATATATTASAGTTWYAYNNRIIAYPTGAGQVYASEDYNLSDENIEWQDSLDVEQVAAFSNLYGYAKPANGWLFAGFTYGTTNEDGTYAYDGTFSYSGGIQNPGFLSLSSSVTDNPSGEGESDSTRVAGMMPLDPNNVVYANFTHVLAEYYPGQSSLGTISVTPFANNIGDQVTLSAVPDAETNPNCKFGGWMLDGKIVSTDADYTITVTDTARYQAYFTADNATDVDFGDGKAVPMYSGDSTDITIPTGFSVLLAYSDSVKAGADRTTMPFFQASYNLSAQMPGIVIGKGKGTFVSSKNEYPYASDNNIGRWTYVDVNVDTLDTDHSYYTFDVSTSTLNLQPAGTVLPAQSFYVALPDSTWDGSKTVKGDDDVTLSAAPQVIYTSDEAATITAIKAVQTTGKRESAKGIYTLDGKRLKALDHEGIFIVDGKKVIYRKK